MIIFNSYVKLPEGNSFCQETPLDLMKNSTEVERLEPLTGGMLDLAGSWVCIPVVGRRWLVNMVE